MREPRIRTSIYRLPRSGLVQRIFCCPPCAAIVYVNATLSPSLQEGATSTLAPARTFAVRFEHTGVVFADEAFSSTNDIRAMDWRLTKQVSPKVPPGTVSNTELPDRTYSQVPRLCAVE